MHEQKQDDEGKKGLTVVERLKVKSFCFYFHCNQYKFRIHVIEECFECYRGDTAIRQKKSPIEAKNGNDFICE